MSKLQDKAAYGCYEEPTDDDLGEDLDEPLEQPTLRKYLTGDESCGTIEARVTLTGIPQIDRQLTQQRRTTMATGETTAVKPTPAEQAAARAKAAADKAKEKAAAKAAAEKAKAEAQKAKEKAKAEAEKEKARLAKEKADAKAKADKEKAAAKAAAEKAKAAEKAAKEKARAEAKAKREAERAANGGKDRLVPADLSKYTKTTEVKTPKGNPCVDTGDKLAQELRGLTLEAVYDKAAKVLGETVKDLTAKYAHLNAGMQRMNLGNRMRAAMAKGH